METELSQSQEKNLDSKLLSSFRRCANKLTKISQHHALAKKSSSITTRIVLPHHILHLCDLIHCVFVALISHEILGILTSPVFDGPGLRRSPTTHLPSSCLVRSPRLAPSAGTSIWKSMSARGVSFRSCLATCQARTA